MIEVEVAHQVGAFALDVNFHSTGRLTALFGRSGAGKTMTVSAIAGLVLPQRGRIVVDGAVLLDTERGIRIPAHRRRVGYVFQESRLFPHLSVRHNLTFGRWFAPKGAPPRFDEIVELLGISPLLDRRPALLSGGEKQRVAIGRALLAGPRLLLMDEPLASLDTGRKDEILPYLERLRDEARVPIVYVSHSIAEVSRLAEVIVLLSEGRVRAVGPVEEVLGRAGLYPLTGRFEAGAVLSAQVSAHDSRFSLSELAGEFGRLTVQHLDLPIGTLLRVRIRARDVILATEPPRSLSALNVLRGTVEALVPIEEAALEVQLGLAGGERLLARVTRRSGDVLGLALGRPVYAVIKTVALDRRNLGRDRPTAPDDEVEVFEG